MDRSTPVLSLCAAAFATWVMLAVPGGAAAQQPASPTESAPAAPSAESGDLARFNASVVRVEAQVPREAQSSETLGSRRKGSGVILEPQLVLTIGYLLLEADNVEVTTSTGRKVPGSVAGYDHATGFGLVRTALPMDGKALELGDSDAVSERQKVLTLGEGEPEATELMVVSRKTFTGSWEYLLERPIYTFPPVNNWSGSALITPEGKLVGIGSLIVNDAAAGQRGVPGNLFVPVNLLKPIYRELVASGRRNGPSQPWLGITTEVVRGNLMVVRVSPNGPAERAGIEPGDVVMSVGSDRVKDQADFYRRLWASGPAGTKVPLRVLKAGEVREIPVQSIDRMDSLRKASGV